MEKQELSPELKELVKDYLKNNLKVSHKVEQGRYGNSGSLTIKIELDYEVLSDSSIDLRELKDDY
jgi:hypothetical protein